MSADFINCSSLFSRFVTKLASEGQRQQFCQLPPLSVLVSFAFLELRQKLITKKKKNLHKNEKHKFYKYVQAMILKIWETLSLKTSLKLLFSFFINVFIPQDELLTLILQEKIHASSKILKYAPQIIESWSENLLIPKNKLINTNLFISDCVFVSLHEGRNWTFLFENVKDTLIKSTFLLIIIPSSLLLLT